MSTLNKAMIVCGSRTPFLDSGGAYSQLMSYELAAHAIRGVLARSDIDPEQLGMVMAGTVVHDLERRTRSHARRRHPVNGACLHNLHGRFISNGLGH